MKRPTKVELERIRLAEMLAEHPEEMRALLSGWLAASVTEFANTLIPGAVKVERVFAEDATEIEGAKMITATGVTVTVRVFVEAPA